MARWKRVRPVLTVFVLLALSGSFFTALATETNDVTTLEDGWYFWNTVTGEVQLDDPGGAANSAHCRAHNRPESLSNMV